MTKTFCCNVEIIDTVSNNSITFTFEEYQWLKSAGISMQTWAKMAFNFFHDEARLKAWI